MLLHSRQKICLLYFLHIHHCASNTIGGNHPNENYCNQFLEDIQTSDNIKVGRPILLLLIFGDLSLLCVLPADYSKISSALIC